MLGRWPRIGLHEVSSVHGAEVCVYRTNPTTHAVYAQVLVAILASVKCVMNFA